MADLQKSIQKQIGAFERQEIRTPYVCLFPGCSKRAIRSHSHQRLRVLRQIAEDGHVVGLERNLYRARPQAPLRSVMKRLGLARATTFRGYCPDHDRDLFAPIERAPLSHNSATQAATLMLRSVSYEIAQKRRAFAFHSHMLSARAIWPPSLVGSSEAMREATNTFLHRDGPYYLDRVLDNVEGRHSDVRWCWYHDPADVGVACSSCVSPLGKHHGEYMRTHWEEPQPLMTVSIVPGASGTHFVVTWLAEHDGLARWVSTRWKETVELQRLANELTFVESEDAVFRPSVWDALGPEVQDGVVHAMRHEMYRGTSCAVPDVIRFGPQPN